VSVGLKLPTFQGSSLSSSSGSDPQGPSLPSSSRKDNQTLMMETKIVPEMSIIFKQLKQLIAPGRF
jgi:hypothetical protein